MAGDSDERILEGGWQRDVRERDGVVYRSPGPQTHTIIDLLRHLEDRGFPGAPRLHGSGLAADGRETFVYIDGAIQHPEPWTDAALAHVGTLIRDLHDATADFMPAPDAVWRPHFARDLPGSDPVIGHGDLGPWNILSRNGQPVAIIDWDYAGPIDRIWELAQAAWLNVQLHDDDVAQGHGLGDAQTRGNQLRILLDAYGLARNEREGFVHRIAEYAIHDVRQEAIEHNITSSTTTGVSETGYPITWALAWRARSASWILRHRNVLESAIL